MRRNIELQINGKQRTVTTDEERPLLDVLREDLSLTGTKYGCGAGDCGACTVLLGNEAIRSCITPVGTVERKGIRTIEGLAPEGKLHPVQQAFLDDEAMQCGYCVPGQILTAVALLHANAKPSKEQIVEAMSGNICRCCNYRAIHSAVQRAANGPAK